MSDAPYVICDVFASAPGQGNQLAVFPNASGLSDAFMQAAANEIGYAETTFLLPLDSDGADARLRIFTPQRELPFAGHPIVGSAVVAAARGLAPRNDSIRFATGAGTIEVQIGLDSERSGRGRMRQPAPEVRRETRDDADVYETARSLGVDPSAIRIDRSPIVTLHNGITVLIVPLDSLATVRALRPDPTAITRLCQRVEAVTMLAFTTETLESKHAAHARVFAPEAGVFEDAATGSANGPLGAYLAEYGLVNGDELINEQGFEMGRPSLLRVTIERAADKAVECVWVEGSVFITGEGRLFPWA